MAACVAYIALKYSKDSQPRFIAKLLHQQVLYGLLFVEASPFVLDS